MVFEAVIAKQTDRLNNKQTGKKIFSCLHIRLHLSFDKYAQFSGSGNNVEQPHKKFPCMRGLMENWSLWTRMIYQTRNISMWVIVKRGTLEYVKKHFANTASTLIYGFLYFCQIVKLRHVIISLEKKKKNCT